MRERQLKKALKLLSKAELRCVATRCNESKKASRAAAVAIMGQASLMACPHECRHKCPHISVNVNFSAFKAATVLSVSGVSALTYPAYAKTDI